MGDGGTRIMRLVLISDTHNQHSSLDLPSGDALVHAGDFTMRGTEGEVAAFGSWLSTQPHSHKIVVAGNPDSAGSTRRSATRNTAWFTRPS